MSAENPTSNHLTANPSSVKEQIVNAQTDQVKIANIVSAVRAQLTESQNLLDRLHQLADQARQQELPLDYIEVSMSILENFIFYVYEDLDRGEYERALEGSYALFELAQITIGELDEILAGHTTAMSVPRYQTSEIHIKGASFYTLTKDSGNGLMAHRPVFFTGYGHFTQVREDIEKFPSYGINLIQVEFGPQRIFPDEETISNTEVEAFLKVLDRAAQSNVAVNLLISPHYFPDWALEKYPHLKQFEGGFLKFCIDAPESRDIIERFIRHVIPQIGNHPALHSICLTNEPMSRKSDQCTFTQALWRDWLEARHGDIEQLNHRHNAQYADFTSVPIPQEPLQPIPLYYDWAIFNQERLAAWHHWMADCIHEISPNLPVHAKVMIWMPFDRKQVMWGVDAELFSDLSDLNGNDCGKWYPHDMASEWENEWQIENMGYDLQRAVADKPIFNSENHLIRDRDVEDIPPVHIRNVLWQGAIHGQSATTIWVWERTFNPESDFAGSIMHRPGCAAMVGMTHLDLMRVSEEVSAIQNLKPEIGILYATSSVIYSEAYLDVLKRTYEALNFTGIKIGFVTERMIEAEKIADYKLIIIPQATHITAEAHQGLQRYVASGGHLIAIGNECLGHDAYDTTYDSEETIRMRASFSADVSARELWEIFEAQLRDWGINRIVSITTEDEQPVWGVEYLTAQFQGRLIVNLVNYTREIKQIYLQVPAGYHQIKNLLIDVEIQGRVIDLDVLEPILLELQWRS